MSRIPLSKALRFEVFKRDKFQCQYCGAKAPDVVLECDHINPVSNGGTNEILNLVTACHPCNNGKSDRRLDETHILERQRAQIEELESRREQLEMMLAWRDQLANLDRDTVATIEETIFAKVERPDLCFAETGKEALGKWIKKFGVETILAALDSSFSAYGRRDESETLTPESVDTIIAKIPAICASIKASEGKPYMRRLYYIRGIINRRFDNVKPWEAIALLEEAVVCGLDLDDIEYDAKRCRSWAQFRRLYEDAIAGGNLR